ncbi:unnamed protein product [Lactuca virosa]|uniref:Bulb-type lectin domain-containing protein n=1 Tax=Lactuca virosa TaxID=75947 RepID=A0AAU9NUU4_9ASTR|nr:unnamed protein product [Lactuca virosa]
MAPAQLRLVFLTIFLRFIAAQNDGSVSVGASLTTTSDVKPWLSSSGEFAFGFKQVQGNDNFLVSIWYEKIPDKTIFWYPEEGRMVPTGSKVELLRASGVVLTDPQGTEVWRSGSISAVASGFMNDTVMKDPFFMRLLESLAISAPKDAISHPSHIGNTNLEQSVLIPL